MAYRLHAAEQEHADSPADAVVAEIGVLLALHLAVALAVCGLLALCGL